MGVIDPRTAAPIGPGPEQDAILKAVGDEITNRGFVIASAAKWASVQKRGDISAWRIRPWNTSQPSLDGCAWQTPGCCTNVSSRVEASAAVNAASPITLGCITNRTRP